MMNPIKFDLGSNQGFRAPSNYGFKPLSNDYLPASMYKSSENTNKEFILDNTDMNIKLPSNAPSLSNNKIPTGLLY